MTLTLVLGFVFAISETGRAAPVFRCESVLWDQDVNGHIDNFRIQIQPPFRIADLQRQRDQLTSQNEKFILGRTGKSHWLVEDRVIGGKKQIVAVKYFHDGEMEMSQNLKRLEIMHEEFKSQGLLGMIDVILPLEVGPDYLVFPFIEAESLSSLTLRRMQKFNPPNRYANPNVFELGPPRREDDPELFHLWEVQQFRLRQIVHSFKINKFKIFEKSIGKSWRGQTYIEYYLFDGKVIAHEGYTIRNDILVTTDGRFVIVDAY